jgi:hypothetical protein
MLRTTEDNTMAHWLLLYLSTGILCALLFGALAATNEDAPS